MHPYFHLGPLMLWSYGLMMGVGLSLGFLFGDADFKRRNIPIPMGIFLPSMAIAGLIGAKLDHAIVVQWHILRQNSLLPLFWRRFTKRQCSKFLTLPLSHRSAWPAAAWAASSPVTVTTESPHPCPGE